MQDSQPTPEPPPTPAPTQPGRADTQPAAAEETLPDMLAQLVPPPQPPTVSMWPATPAAKGLTALLVLLLLYLAWRQLQRYIANAYRRAALAELQRAQQDPAQIAEILRRTALAAYPRSQVASLTGDDWLAFLNRHYPGNAFSGDVGCALLQSPYRRTAPAQSDALAQAARDWIRQHRGAPTNSRHLPQRRQTAEAAP